MWSDGRGVQVIRRISQVCARYLLPHRILKRLMKDQHASFLKDYAILDHGKALAVQPVM